MKAASLLSPQATQGGRVGSPAPAIARAERREVAPGSTTRSRPDVSRRPARAG
ncbi:MAG: hypothetical protein L0332_07405 [Chloroflexi bacterium]|nr:hypothetical protein [Chloroflexota bacterium]MCI0726535.1 hypothetical protein [Chloroflexota bacterium]